MRDVGLAEISIRLARSRDDATDRQPELLRERVVALVVGRDRHDRARPVARQDVVGDPDRDPLTVDRIDRVGADRDPGLLPLGRQPLDLRLVLGPGDIGLDLGPSLRGGQGRDERMLRRKHQEGRPEERVGARREHPDLLAALGAEGDLGPF